MIRFKCRCSHLFAVEDDQAGAAVQCPDCGLLVDVPTLSDLPHLEDDGTFRMSEEDVRHERNRLNTLYRTFTRDHVDPNTGEEIDLRLGPKDADSDRLVDPTQIKDPRAVRPKYDPETGELIRPLDVAGDDEPRPAGGSIPIAAPVVGYALPYTMTVPSASTIAMELFMPMNVTVMFFVSFGYLLGHFFLATVYLYFLNLPVAALLLAHYGVVVEDTGPEAKDELPRPLRHLEFGPDLWWPFVRMFCSLVICYGPSAFALIDGVPWQFALVLGGVGSFFLPAVMLTLGTSGSIENLRPDRVMAVIRLVGWRYGVAVGIWVVTVALHLWTWVGIFFLVYWARNGLVNPKLLIFNHHLVVFPMVAIAIYLMHYFCWFLGVQYRRHQHEFPWVLQHHAHQYRTNTVGALIPPRRSQPRNRLARPR